MRKPKTRIDESKYSSSDKETEEETLDRLREEQEIIDDPFIIAYEDPSIDEMKYILQMAEDYKGDWYHSEVGFNIRSSFINTDERRELENKIMNLKPESGVFVFYYDS